MIWGIALFPAKDVPTRALNFISNCNYYIILITLYYISRTMASVRRSVAVRKQLRDPVLTRVFGELMGKYDRSFTMRTYVHDILFNETIWAQGTTEQYQQWEGLIKNYNVIGCFAMTEMGHSSFLRGKCTQQEYTKASRDSCKCQLCARN